ncbi:Canalicular multispecific organic anion transporter 2 [Coemansia sp. BCRC 34962]|nr:Canalicular multispecific organic anion transporter 2 [Coemansia sp. BCRC 34962]
MFPTMLASVINSNVALGRIHKLLTSEELDLESVTRLESVRRSSRKPPTQDSAGRDEKNVAVLVSSGSFRWSSKDSVQLDNINLSALSGEHLAIVGRVGAGKSSLLSALLGDMRKEAGNVVVRGQVAYVPQQPCIMNATLRSNILFGLKYDESFYNRVIDACALRPDLEMLTAGDMTEIGEKGINL